MAKTVSDFLLERLYEWGVRRIFGFPGDGINGIMGAMDRARGRKDSIELVQVRHEEMAAFEACGHAKFTGEVGVCLATSGPGAIHLLNGLYDAKGDHQPVVAIVGQTDTGAIGSDYQQEVDLISLFKDVAHNFVQMAGTPVQVRQLVDRAFRIARTERTVTCIILPKDVQEMDAVETPPRRHGFVVTSNAFSPPNIYPRRKDLMAAADILNSGRKVAILVGAGALDAYDEVVQTADALGAGVAKALLGKSVLPDDIPWVTGTIGLLGTKPSWDMMKECDTFLMVGSGFPYSEFLPKPGQARGVQIDIKSRQLGLRYPMDMCLQGDSALTLRALLPLLKPKRDQGWRRSIENNVAEWWRIVEARSHLSADPINPQRIFWELSPLVPDNSIICCDTGSLTTWFAHCVKIRRGMMSSVSGTLATMCPGVPYSIAAKFAHPNRVVIGLIGDGSMEMIGNAELLTIAKYWKQWSDPRLVILVLQNCDLNMVSWEQRVMSGDPKFSGSQDIPAFHYARYAELLGLTGIRVEKPEQIEPAWKMALSADRPVVIDALGDGNVPPLPPHITFEQAKGYMTSLIKGDPDEWAIIGQSAKQMMETYLARFKK